MASTGARTPREAWEGGALRAEECVGAPPTVFSLLLLILPKGSPRRVEVRQCRQLEPWKKPIFLHRGTKKRGARSNSV